MGSDAFDPLYSAFSVTNMRKCNPVFITFQKIDGMNGQLDY